MRPARRRDPRGDHERDRMAGSQRARIYQQPPWQEDGPHGGVQQERNWRTKLSNHEVDRPEVSFCPPAPMFSGFLAGYPESLRKCVLCEGSSYSPQRDLACDVLQLFGWQECQTGPRAVTILAVGAGSLLNTQQIGLDSIFGQVHSGWCHVGQALLARTSYS